MAGNLAAVALKRGVPLAANAFARIMPTAVAKAKEYVGKATGVAASTVNLGQVASADGGMRAQIVAEAMVKSGFPVDKLWSHIPSNMVDDVELVEYRAQLMAIQAFESKESSGAALGSSVPRNLALQIDEKNRSIRFLMKMLGTSSPAEVWNFKVELDHLHETDIENFTLLNYRG